MAEKITIINNRKGKVMLGPDPEELKAFNALPEAKRAGAEKPKGRTVEAGHTIDVSPEEAELLMRHRGLQDMSKIKAGPRVKDLEAQLAAEKAKNAELVKKLGEGAPALGDDDEVVLEDGRKGVIVKLKGKKADVKLEDESIVKGVAVDSLKAA